MLVHNTYCKKEVQPTLFISFKFLLILQEMKQHKDKNVNWLRTLVMSSAIRCQSFVKVWLVQGLQDACAGNAFGQDIHLDVFAKLGSVYLPESPVLVSPLT